jgi:sodium/potassium/calcium exchanger 6
MNELKDHFTTLWLDIFENEENNLLDKFLQVCEMPFVIARKVSVPIPCDGYYCRALVALSVFMSPLWFGVYLWNEYDIHIFKYASMAMIVTFAIGAMILRFAPGGDGTMALFVSAPLAFYGFILAATWIDFIADHLVSLLDFLGIVCRIPGSIMGLTILAWGNSMGDLSANMTMARKGLANMAITACFAGPVFNILVGLGLGFSSLSAKTGEAEKEVQLSPSVLTGFIFIVLNTLMVIVSGVFIMKGFIPKQFGYLAVGLYLIYVATSLVLQFRSSGDDQQ